MIITYFKRIYIMPSAVLFIFIILICNESKAKSDRISCERNDFKACYNLGQKYKALNNPSSALQFWRKACTGGMPEGCFNAAVTLQDLGSTKDADVLYLAACKDRLAVSCTNYGNSELARNNSEEAAKYFKLGCDGGDTTGCQNLKFLNESPPIAANSETKESSNILPQQVVSEGSLSESTSVSVDTKCKDADEQVTPELIDENFYQEASYSKKLLSHWLLGEKISALTILNSSIKSELPDFDDSKRDKKIKEFFEQHDKRCEYTKKIQKIVDTYNSNWVCDSIKDDFIKVEKYPAFQSFQSVNCAGSVSCESSKSTVEFNLHDAWIIPFDGRYGSDGGILFLNQSRLSCAFADFEAPIGNGRRHSCGMVISKEMEQFMAKQSDEEYSKVKLMACYRGPFKIKKAKDPAVLLTPKESGILLLKDNKKIIFEKFD